ncbi:hypothetical protein HK102_004301 [Quaeritorhiza haematococci]|nr:hypothetical protein HK102_004301 [Quaeritorhiza haematococci]
MASPQIELRPQLTTPPKATCDSIIRTEWFLTAERICDGSVDESEVSIEQMGLNRCFNQTCLSARQSAAEKIFAACPEGYVAGIKSEPGEELNRNGVIAFTDVLDTTRLRIETRDPATKFQCVVRDAKTQELQPKRIGEKY